MYCSQCGRQMEMGARFCSACGTAWQPVAAPRRQLMRPREGRFIAGVCAALALEYGWDVPVVRLISALALLVSFGTVALVYFIAWVVIPEAPYALPSRGTGTAV